MKIFQIENNRCHWDATPIHPTIADTVGKYAPEVVFVEAPDYVFEGWGYDSTESGEERFIKPLPPDGWTYNEHTGAFEQIAQPGMETDQISAAEALAIIMGGKI